MKDKPAGSGTAVAAGVSPHAPYSTPFDLVAYCVDLAREQQIPLAMHVAESDEERQLIEQGNDHSWISLRASCPQRASTFLGDKRPLTI